MGVRIIGTGSFAPDRILTNQDLEKMVSTSDEWITSRTGIKQRHISEPGIPTSELALPAALRAIESAGIKPEDLSLLSVATVTPDYRFPSAACILQHKLGTTTACACYDIQAACSGLLYSMDLAVAMLKTRPDYRYALIIGAEKLSCIVDWTDRSTCVLFGDAASALVLENDHTDSPDSLVSSVLGADGTHSSILRQPAGGSAQPATHESVDQHLHCIHMGGQEVFKLAVTAMVSASRDALDRAGVAAADLRWIIPHQANKRIIDAVSQRLGVEADHVYVNVDRYGNTSAASIGICLDELVRGGQLERGDLVLLTAFGAGMTWGATLIRW